MFCMHILDTILISWTFASFRSELSTQRRSKANTSTSSATSFLSTVFGKFSWWECLITSALSLCFLFPDISSVESKGPVTQWFYGLRDSFTRWCFTEIFSALNNCYINKSSGNELFKNVCRDYRCLQESEPLFNMNNDSNLVMVFTWQLLSSLSSGHNKHCVWSSGENGPSDEGYWNHSQLPGHTVWCEPYTHFPSVTCPDALL